MIKQLIWLNFLKTEEPEFREKVGYGKKEIIEIGIPKFIQRMGWGKPEDVKSWRTDALALVICPHCKNDFGALDTFGGGLCKTCMEKYDLRTFHFAINHAAKNNKEMEILGLFFGQEFYRSMYSKDDKVKRKARRNFKENLTTYMFDKYRKQFSENDALKQKYMDAKEDEIKKIIEAKINGVLEATKIEGREKT